MTVFPEIYEADIEIKRIQLVALRDKLKRVEPLYAKLQLEIEVLVRDIDRLEEEGKEF